MRLGVFAGVGSFLAGLAFGLALLAGAARAANTDTGAILSLAAAGAGTTNSADQINPDGRGLFCVFNMSAHTGTPSTTYSVQVKDAASGAYVSLLTSGAITNDATPTTLAVYPAAAASANLSISLPVGRVWRLSATVGGTTPGVTATAGCNLVN